MRPIAPRAFRLGALLLGLPALIPAGWSAEPKSLPAEESIELPKMQVKGTPVCSFGIGIVGMRDAETRKIKRLFISEVVPDSEAAQLGLKEHDEILAINGMWVTDMDGAMKAGSPLFDLLVNQAPGQVVTLEVAIRTRTTLSLSAKPIGTVMYAPIIRIKTGITSLLTDEAGVTWRADAGFVGGEVANRPGLAIADTATPSLYRIERHGMSAFRWRLLDGKYIVRLHFAETSEAVTGPGQRVFSFNVEGWEFKNFDVWAMAGGGLKAYVETVAVEVTDASLDIAFTPKTGDPVINAIEIFPERRESNNPIVVRVRP